MTKTRRNLPVVLVCIAVVLLAFLSGSIPFYIYEETQLHSTVEEFFSMEHLARLLPFILIAAASAVLILIIIRLRKKQDKNQGIISASSCTSGRIIGQKKSVFMTVRWIIMLLFSFTIMFGGILSGTVLQGISFPVLACPTNRDQLLESSCYFLAHIPELLEEYSVGGILLFFGTTIGFALLFGRVICGFMCPMGLIQDTVHQIRQKTRVKGIRVNEFLYKRFRPLKWLMVLLMLGIVFAGGNFCNFCPALATSPVFAGMKVSLYLSGFMMIAVIVGGFFKRRFWCNICPLGLLIGLLHKISPFRIKKNVLSCTECGACYEACPMGVKIIYTERSKTDVTDMNCIMCGECIRKCPEDDALAMTFAGKKIYSASRKQAMSGFEKQNRRKKHEKEF